MTDAARTLAGFLRLVEIEARDAPAHPNAFDRIRAGDLQAVMVHGLYEPDVLEGINARLECHDPAFLKTWFPEEFRADGSFGAVLCIEAMFHFRSRRQFFSEAARVGGHGLRTDELCHRRRARPDADSGCRGQHHASGISRLFRGTSRRLEAPRRDCADGAWHSPRERVGVRGIRLRSDVRRDCHAAVGDGTIDIVTPLLFLALVAASWALRPASRMLPARASTAREPRVDLRLAA